MVLQKDDMQLHEEFCYLKSFIIHSKDKNSNQAIILRTPGMLKGRRNDLSSYMYENNNKFSMIKIGF